MSKKDTVWIKTDERGNSWMMIDQEEVQRRAEEVIKEELHELIDESYSERDLSSYWHMSIAKRIDEQSAVIYESPADYNDGTYYSHNIATTKTLVFISADKGHCGLNGRIQLTKNELKEITDVLDLVPTSTLQARLIRGWSEIIGTGSNRYKDSITGAKENAFTIASALRCAKRFCELLEQEEEAEKQSDNNNNNEGGNDECPF